MSLNESITRELKERIGNLPDGARFATEAELCGEFGVSRMTKKFLPTLAIMAMIAFTPMLFGYFGFDFLQELSLMNFLGRA